MIWKVGHGSDKKNSDPQHCPNLFSYLLRLLHLPLLLHHHLLHFLRLHLPLLLHHHLLHFLRLLHLPLLLHHHLLLHFLRLRSITYSFRWIRVMNFCHVVITIILIVDLNWQRSMRLKVAYSLLEFEHWPVYLAKYFSIYLAKYFSTCT